LNSIGKDKRKSKLQDIQEEDERREKINEKANEILINTELQRMDREEGKVSHVTPKGKRRVTKHR
jgi:hypothetical protein